GRHKPASSGPTPSRSPRRRHISGDPSETTPARPAATADPANSPPAAIFAISTDSSVVLPAFHRLVNSVTTPPARYPVHSQRTSFAADWRRSSYQSGSGTIGFAEADMRRWRTSVRVQG